MVEVPISDNSAYRIWEICVEIELNVSKHHLGVLEMILEGLGESPYEGS